MPKDVKCKNCLNLKNEWCDKKNDSPCPDILRDCRYFCQKTNGDVIRAMSDEELAQTQSVMLAKACKQIHKGLSPLECEKADWCGDLSPCDQCVLDCLEQPAEE